MLHILIDKLRIVALILVGILLIKRTQRIGFRTPILRLRKAELRGTACFGENSFDGFVHHAVLGHNSHVKGINSLRHQVGAVFHLSLQERAVGLLGNLPQTAIEHSKCCVLQILGHHIFP